MGASKPAVGSEQGHVFASKTSARRPVRFKRSAIVALVGLATAVTLSACGSSHRPVASAGGVDTIVIKDFAFGPSTLSVAPGAKVTVRNSDPATHTVTSTGSPRLFDTGDIKAGATVTFIAPTVAGTYPYICEVHQFMHGTLEVR